MSILSTLSDRFSNLAIFDVYHVNDSNMVRFYCDHKDIEVQGVLAEALQFSLDSKWDRSALGGLKDSKVLETVDNLASSLLGVSINQPILNRRAWGGTSPLGMSVRMRFMSASGASGQIDVYDPVVKLASLLIPRIITDYSPDKTVLGIFSMPGPSPFGKLISDSVLYQLQGYKPGKEDFSGDSVEVTIGKMVYASKAYITKIVGSFSLALCTDGFPQAAEVTVTFENIDTPFSVGTSAGYGKNNVFRNTNYMANGAGASSDILGGWDQAVGAAKSMSEDNKWANTAQVQGPVNQTPKAAEVAPKTTWVNKTFPGIQPQRDFNSSMLYGNNGSNFNGIVGGHK